MKIKSIEVKKLHNKYDKKVIFNDDISLLYGLNGSGKTTILNILAYSLRCDFESLLMMYDFLEVAIEYYNGDKPNTYIIKNQRKTISITYNDENITIERNIHFDEENFYRQRIYLNNKQSYDFIMRIKEDFNCIYLPLNRIQKYYSVDALERNKIRQYRRTIGEEYRHDYNDDIESVSEIIRSNYNQISRLKEENIEKFKKELLKSLFTFEPIKLNSIEFNKDSPKKAKEYLKILINNDIITDEQLKKYEDFIKNIMESADDKNKNIEELIINIYEFSKIVKILKYSSKFDEQNKKINAPIDLFLEIVNRFFNNDGGNKKVELLRDGELCIKEGNNNITANMLSSGEKQIITFFAYLVFKSTNSKSSIIIIDEPELSLHLSWQKIFIKECKNANSDAQFIFATHSPEIVGGYRKSMINIS